MNIIIKIMQYLGLYPKAPAAVPLCSTAIEQRREVKPTGKKVYIKLSPQPRPLTKLEMHAEAAFFSRFGKTV